MVLLLYFNTDESNRQNNHLYTTLMYTLRKKLEDLNSEVVSRFDELRKQNPIITFLTDEEVDDGEFNDEYFDVTNDNTGLAVEVGVVKIDEDGIHVIESKDYNRIIIGFHGFHSIADRINLVELIEAKLNIDKN